MIWRYLFWMVTLNCRLIFDVRWCFFRREVGLWDEARVFKGPKSLKSGIQAPLINANPKSTLNINQDQLLYYYSTFQKHQLEF